MPLPPLPSLQTVQQEMQDPVPSHIIHQPIHGFRPTLRYLAVFNDGSCLLLVPIPSVQLARLVVARVDLVVRIHMDPFQVEKVLL